MLLKILFLLSQMQILVFFFTTYMIFLRSYSFKWVEFTQNGHGIKIFRYKMMWLLKILRCYWKFLNFNWLFIVCLFIYHCQNQIVSMLPEEFLVHKYFHDNFDVMPWMNTRTFSIVIRLYSMTFYTVLLKNCFCLIRFIFKGLLVIIIS